MNTDLTLEIFDLALSLVADTEERVPSQDAAVAATLLQIVQKGAQAYAVHTGQPLDVSLLKPETRYDD